MQEALYIVLVEKKPQNSYAVRRHCDKAIRKYFLGLTAIVGPLIINIMIQEFMNMIYAGDGAFYKPSFVKLVIRKSIKGLTVTY